MSEPRRLTKRGRTGVLRPSPSSACGACNRQAGLHGLNDGQDRPTGRSRLPPPACSAAQHPAAAATACLPPLAADLLPHTRLAFQQTRSRWAAGASRKSSTFTACCALETSARAWRARRCGSEGRRRGWGLAVPHNSLPPGVVPGATRLPLPRPPPQVYVLWPDDGTWYRGQVEEVDEAAGKASIFYSETEEQEEADLKELVGDRQIAFSECWAAAGGCRRGCAVPAVLRGGGGGTRATAATRPPCRAPCRGVAACQPRVPPREGRDRGGGAVLWAPGGRC